MRGKITIARARGVFNRWIRNRDQDKGCISCGGPVENAGHYYPAGLFTALRFNEMNVNGQCVQCNKWKHGNLISYRQGLINRYGEQKVLLLESAARHAVKRWSKTELQWIIENYKL